MVLQTKLKKMSLGFNQTNFEIRNWWWDWWLKGDVQISNCGLAAYGLHTHLSTIWQTMSQFFWWCIFNCGPDLTDSWQDHWLDEKWEFEWHLCRWTFQCQRQFHIAWQLMKNKMVKWWKIIIGTSNWVIKSPLRKLCPSSVIEGTVVCPGPNSPT